MHVVRVVRHVHSMSVTSHMKISANEVRTCDVSLFSIAGDNSNVRILSLDSLASCARSAHCLMTVVDVII